MGWLADLLEERGSVSIQEGLGKPLASAMGPKRKFEDVGLVSYVKAPYLGDAMLTREFLRGL